MAEAPTAEQILEAIGQGIADAFWRMMTNGTDMPSADFFDAIKHGVREATAMRVKEKV